MLNLNLIKKKFGYIFKKVIFILIRSIHLITAYPSYTGGMLDLQNRLEECSKTW